MTIHTESIGTLASLAILIINAAKVTVLLFSKEQPKCSLNTLKARHNTTLLV